MLIAFVLAIAALFLGRRVFIPLALAVVFSFLLTPPVMFLERVRFRRIPAVTLVLVLSLGLVGGVGWAVAGQLVQIIIEFPDYKANLDEKIQALHPAKDGNLSKATATMHELNKELAALPDAIAANNNEQKQKGATRPIHSIPVQIAAPTSNIYQDLSALLGPLAGPLETAAIVVIFTIFMLVKREDLRNRAIRLAGRGQLTVMTQALDDAGRRLSRYLLLQFLVNGGYGLVFGVALYFIGVPHALIWGVLASLLRFVPYVGALISAALPTALALAVFPGWHHAVLILAAYVVLDVSISNVLEPILYGAHTGVSSLAILIAAIFWATLWGPVGLILSTPLTVCLMVLGRYVPQLSFLEILLGDEPVLPPEQQFYQRLLAMDPEEARTIAEAYVKEHSVADLYESILIPALKLAEQDRIIENLDDDSRAFMFQSVKELIEDMGDRLEEDPSAVQAEGGSEDYLQSHKPNRLDTIACIPARSGSDELIVAMLAQLLRHEGLLAKEFKPGTVDHLLSEINREDSAIVCLSAIPPSSVSYARSLCKMVKASASRVQIVIGMWNMDGDTAKARERLGPGCAALVSTSLADVVVQVRGLTTAEAVGDITESRSVS